MSDIQPPSQEPVFSRKEIAEESKVYDAEVTDRKGRKVATRITITTYRYQVKPPSNEWGGYTLRSIPEELRSRALAGEAVLVYENESDARRDGKSFGAIAVGSRKHFTSFAAAAEAREKSGAAAIKRNRKQFGSLPGAERHESGKNPSTMKLYQHLSHGFYFVTDTEARKLARAANAKLPSFGREVRVEVARGVLGWLARTPTAASVQGGPKRGWVWSISRFSDEKFVPISVMAQPSREALIAEADQLVERLEALGHRQAPNYRGVMVRVVGSKFHRPPPAPATAASEDLSTAELRDWVQNFRLDARVASEAAARRAAKHESGNNPLTLGERAKMRLGVLSPTASRAAASREKELLRRQVADVKSLSESLEACRRCEPGAERAAKKVLVKAKETLKGLEKLAHYRHEGDVAEAVMRPLRNQIAAAEALVTGEKAVVEVRGVSVNGAGKKTARVVQVEGVPSAEWHEAGGNPRVRAKYPEGSVEPLFPLSGRAFPCKTHKGAHPYRVCRKCGKQFCPHNWAECPRCVPGAVHGEGLGMAGPFEHESGKNPRTRRSAVAALHGEETEPYPYPDEREAGVARLYGRKAQGGGWSGRMVVAGEARPHSHAQGRKRSRKAEPEREWEHNASTGNDILKVGKNARVIRMSGGGLYMGEYWGDHSLSFPVHGGWRPTLQQAMADIKKLERKHEPASKHESGKNPHVAGKVRSHSHGLSRKKVRPEPERLVVGGTLKSRIERLLGKNR